MMDPILVLQILVIVLQALHWIRMAYLFVKNVKMGAMSAIQQGALNVLRIGY